MSKKIGLYEIVDDEIGKLISKKNIKTAFVQLPEGLQQYCIQIKDWLTTEYQIQVIIDALANYGACDIPEDSLLTQLSVDALIQIGHFPIPSMNIEKRDIPILYLNARSTIPVLPIIEKSITKIKDHRIGLLTTAQHAHLLNDMKNILEKNGFSVNIGKGDGRIYSPGQVLGCNFSVATNQLNDVDSFLFVGSGFFHPLGLLLATDKPVIVADPYLNKVIDSTDIHEKKQQILRQRYGAITFAKQAKIIGIIIGLKPGQMRLQLANELKTIIEGQGKKCLIFASNIINSDLADRFPFIDVFVSTACPRIAIDDYISYKKPILTPVELKIALNKQDWDEYQFDEF